jgi:hypothetical protein
MIDMVNLPIYSIQSYIFQLTLQLQLQLPLPLPLPLSFVFCIP